MLLSDLDGCNCLNHGLYYLPSKKLLTPSRNEIESFSFYAIIQKECFTIKSSAYRPLSFLCAPVTLVVWSPDEDDTIRGSARLPNLNIVGTPRLVMA